MKHHYFKPENIKDKNLEYIYYHCECCPCLKFPRYTCEQVKKESEIEHHYIYSDSHIFELFLQGKAESALCINMHQLDKKCEHI